MPEHLPGRPVLKWNPVALQRLPAQLAVAGAAVLLLLGPARLTDIALGLNALSTIGKSAISRGIPRCSTSTTT